MSKKLRHIDEIFKSGLKNLRMLVSDKDMDAIESKASIVKDPEDKKNNTSLSDFELPVSHEDWLSTKARLDSEKQNLSTHSDWNSTFSDFSIPVADDEWPPVYEKLQKEKKRRAFWWIILKTGVIALILGITSLWIFNSNSEKPELVHDTNNTQNLSNSSQKDDSNNSSPTSPETSIPSMHENNAEDSQPEVQKSGNSAEDKLNSHTASNQNDPNPSSMSKIPTEKIKTETMNELVKSKDEGIETSEVDESNSQNKETEANSGSSISSESHKELRTNTPQGVEVKVLLAKAQDTTLPKDKTLPPPPKNFSNWSVGAFIGVDRLSRIADRQNPQNFNSVFNASKMVSNALTMGISVERSIKNVSIESGLRYSVGNYQNNYNYRLRIYDSLPVYDQTGTKIIGHFLTRGRDTVFAENTQIRVSTLSLPLAIRIPILSKGKLGLSLIPGFQFSMTQVSGNGFGLYPANMRLYPSSTLSEFERKYNMAATLGAGVHYKLNKQWIIGADIRSSLFLKSEYKSEYGASVYPATLGIQFRLNYLIFK